MEKLNNGYLMRYLDDNITLVKTMVIKLNDTALLMNEGIALTYGEAMVDVNHPETWKYYMNISGSYHPTDTLMKVVSIDTLQEIDFTVENLKVHTATADAYRYGTRQYFLLLRNFPTQEFLINGILNPVDITKALEAADGDIISYRKDLVEINEHSLISDLQQYAKYQIERWYNTQFNMAHDLYCMTFITLMQSNLLQKLLNIRLKRCHSYETHSFHVRMFLASHNELDRYLPFLTLKQSLWLYRNIRFIERHAGLMFQFYRLIEHLLSDRGIPIGEYKVKQQDSYINYLPTTIAKSNPLNGEYNKLYSNEHLVSDLFTKELDDAVDNTQYLKYNQDSQLQRFVTSTSADVQTKVLHSSMTDLSGAIPDTFEAIAMRQWCHMALNGLYDCYVTFKDVKSSLTYSLSTKDAFFYMHYITLRKLGLTLNNFPEFLNIRQRRHPKPTVNDLLKVVDYKERDLQYIAEAIVGGQPVISPCFSTSAFFDLCEKLFVEAYWHMFLISDADDYYERALVENMVHQLYEDERISFHLGSSSVAEWLALNNLPDYAYDDQEADLMMKAIFEASTGLKVENNRILKNIQKALIELMKELSSYSIQFVREINTENIIVLNWPAVRFGNQKQNQEITRLINNGVILQDAPSEIAGTFFVGNNAVDRIAIAVNDLSYTGTQEVDAVVDEYYEVTVEAAYSDPDSKLFMSISYPEQDVVLEQKERLVGLTSFHALSEIQKRALKSI